MPRVIRPERIIAAGVLLLLAAPAFSQVRPPVRPPSAPRPVFPPTPRPPFTPHVPRVPIGPPARHTTPVIVLNNSQRRQRDAARQDEAARKKFREEIQAKTKSQPHEALRLLVDLPKLPNSKQPVVAPPEQQTLARQALRKLAERVEADTDAWKSLFHLWHVGLGKDRAAARRLAVGDDGELVLQTMATRSERRALAETVQHVRKLVENRRWGEAFAQGRRPSEHPALKSSGVAPTWKMPADVNETLDEVEQRGRLFDAHARLEAVLKVAENDRQTLRPALRQLDLAPLPAALANRVRGLQGLVELRELAKGTNRLEREDVPQIRQNLGYLDFCTADGQLASRLRQGFAVKFFVSGHPAEARSLLSGKSSPAEAAALLHDLKTLIAGQGDVSSWPARQVVLAQTGRTGVPPGLRSLLPQEGGDAWKPQVREAVGPSPLDELARLEKPQRERVADAYRPVQVKFEADAAGTLRRLRQLEARYQPAPRETAAAAALLADLKTELKRDPVPTERFLALGLSGQGKNVTDIVVALQRFNAQPSVAQNRKP